MNIFLFEFKMYRKSIFVWSLAIPFFLFLYMAFYPFMATDTEGIDMLMNEMPKAIIDFMGMNPDLPMSSITGYFTLTFSFIQIPIAINASNYGFHMLSVEERELTADFLLSKPIKRSKILISKFLAAFLSLTIINASIWAASLASIYIFKVDSEIEILPIIYLLSSIVFFQLFFMSIGMLISVSLKKIESVLSYSMGLSFGLYIASTLKAMLGVNFIEFLSPFSYFNPTNMIIDGKFDLVLTLVCILVIISSITITYFLYLKRNIHSL